MTRKGRGWPLIYGLIGGDPRLFRVLDFGHFAVIGQLLVDFRMDAYNMLYPPSRHDTTYSVCRKMAKVQRVYLRPLDRSIVRA